jgi:molybdenum cofactor cytidylyltransferase
MQLSKALRLTSSFTPTPSQIGHEKVPLIIAFTGAGGKTTAIFQIAREILATDAGIGKVIISATSHLATWQRSLADQHYVIDSPHDFKEIPKGVTLITGQIIGDRSLPINSSTLNWLREYSIEERIPLLLEADGSRGRPIKVPAPHEPPIPEFVNMVIVVAGLSSIGKLLNETNVFRANLFRSLSISTSSQFDADSLISMDMLVEILNHPEGGLKNIPPDAHRTVLLNQAESPELLALAGNMSDKLLEKYHSVVAGSLHQREFQLFEKTAGIILAAGPSSRYGTSKQLLEWHGVPFARHVAKVALDAGLQPVVLVTGYNSRDVESVTSDLPIVISRNDSWELGQSSSIKEGLLTLPDEAGSAIFLLADQPQIKPNIIRSLMDHHTQSLAAIIAPLVNGEKRGNPVLFDRVTFLDLLQLTGDMGGRGIFHKYKVEFLPWHDENILLDVDTPEDYWQLITRHHD